MAGVKRLLFINLKFDEDDQVLGFSVDWYKELSKSFHQADVFSGQYVGERRLRAGHLYGVPKSGSKILLIIETFLKLFKLYRKNRYDVVFFHMNPSIAILYSPISKLSKSRTILWYAHGKVSWKIRIARYCVDEIVSSSKMGFRLNSKKLRVIGQGIVTPELVNGFMQTDYNTLIYAGRISKIKRIELVFELLERLLSRGLTTKVRIYGEPISKADEDYYNSLLNDYKSLFKTADVRFCGKQTKQEMQKIFQSQCVFFNPSNTGSMDKTVLEAASNGCLVYTTNEAYSSEEWRDTTIIFSDNLEYIENDLCGRSHVIDTIQIKKDTRNKIIELHGLSSLNKRLLGEV